MILTIINKSTNAYRDVIPIDRCHEPYLSFDDLHKEMRHMTFFACEEDGMPLGVVGFQPVKDVTLLKNQYVHLEHQRRAIARNSLNI
jgi:hypothetical protein